MRHGGGGEIQLFSDRIDGMKRPRQTSAENLGHELSHASLYDLQHLGRAGAPALIEKLAPLSDQGALDWGGHGHLKLFWHGEF